MRRLSTFLIGPVMRTMPARWLFSTVIVVLTTAVLQFIRQTIGLAVANVSLGYIVAVLLVAITYGLGPGVLASVLAFIAYIFFFVPPLHTFSVATSQDLIRLFLFLGVAIVTSSIAARSRARAEEARHRALIQEALYGLSQAISTEVAAEAILPAIAEEIMGLLHADGCVILLSSGNTTLRPAVTIGRIGRDSDAITNPLRVGARTLGVVRVWEQAAVPFTDEAHRLLDALSRQAALAVERTRLVAETTKLQIVTESDRLKSALLHSISHDLRTPLAAIKGAASNLRDENVVWNPDDQRALLETIETEADRLNRLVRNLLDMSHIEAGSRLPPTEFALFEDVLGPVLRRLRPTLNRHRIAVDVPEDFPFVPMAILQIDQVLTNLLENAAKYAPVGTTITISASQVDDTVQVSIADQGLGIPVSERERIFDKFYRLSEPECSSGGAGLGLAICKYWVDAHGGRIWTHPAPGGGAMFSFTLPLHAVPPPFNASATNGQPICGVPAVHAAEAA
jgi:two-component system sensor histidine kinase KdpD